MRDAPCMIVGAEASKVQILRIVSTAPDLTIGRGFRFFGDSSSAGPTAIRVCHARDVYVLGFDTTDLPSAY